MSKEKVEKKEKTTVKEKKVTKIDKVDQRRLRTLSKVVYIFAKILKVFAIIAIVGMAIAMILVPVIVGNVKVSDDKVTVFGEEVEYTLDDGKLIMSIDEAKIGEFTGDEKIAFEYAIKEMKGAKMVKTFAYVELVLVFGVATLVIYVQVLNHAHNLFKNIYDYETPFTKDNSYHFKKIAYLLFIMYILSLVSSAISSLFLKSDVLNLNLTTLSTIVILYIGSYIFEYACILQSNSKVTLYDEDVK